MLRSSDVRIPEGVLFGLSGCDVTRAGSLLRERPGTGVPASAEAYGCLRGVESRLPWSGARLKRSLNGLRRRLSVSCVGLWRGLIARNTFGLAIRTLAANSLTPIARITFPSASCRSTPSSIAASRNSRAKAGSRRSFASPTFQSSLRLATTFALLIRLPGLLRPRHVCRLGGLVATEQQEHELRTVLTEVDRYPGPNTTRASQTPPPTLLWSPRFQVEKRSTLA